MPDIAPDLTPGRAPDLTPYLTPGRAPELRPGSAGGAGGPLLVSADPDLTAAVRGLAALTGRDVDVVPSLDSAAARWRAAPVVLVGGDVADQPVPSQRPDVLLVSGGRSGPAVDALARETGWPVVCLPDDERWLADRLLAVEGAVAAGSCVGVVGGRGGAGASTLAAALAVTAAADGPSLLVDLDPLGGGLDLLVGLEDAPGLRWSDLASVAGPLSGSALARSLPARDALRVLAWDRSDVVVGPAVAGSVLESARRTYALTVLDLPRCAVGETETLAACDTVLLVVPAEVRAVAAARRVLAQSAALPDVRLVVRGPSPSRLTGPDVAELLGRPLAGWLRPDQRLPAEVERGRPPGQSRGRLAALCQRLVGDLLDPAATASRRRATGSAAA